MSPFDWFLLIATVLVVVALLVLWECQERSKHCPGADSGRVGSHALPYHSRRRSVGDAQRHSSAISLTVAILAVGALSAPRAGSIAIRSASAFGLFAAAFLFATAALHIGASGPLRHMAGLKDEWGEAAYLAFQVASQASLISGLLTLCLWVVALSLIGLRTKIIPIALCVLGILPAMRLLGGVLGPLGLMPEGLWILAVISIPGTFLWCLLLGVVLLRRGAVGAAEPRVDPAAVGA